MPSDLDLPDLPPPSSRRIAARVTKDALRHIRKQHPWVYDDSITSLSHAGGAGDLVVVFDDERNFAGIGLFDPDSPIRIKMLHAGKPATIDATWWSGQVGDALAKRAWLIERADTTGYRVLNGENDGFPGLVVDRYAETLVVKIYTAAWFPHLGGVLDALVASIGPTQIVVRLGRNVAAGECYGLSDGLVILGEAQEPIEFSENGLRLLAHPMSGQKTGFFLDQRDNRNRVREIANGARVLDVFSCTGGFSVAAAAGGAREVTSIDSSGVAIEIAAQNMALNQHIPAVAKCSFDGVVGDAFEVMDRLRRERKRYGLVIVDPPSFAQRQVNISAGLRAYGRLTQLAVDLVEPGGRLVQASCSSRITADDFHDQVQRSAQAAGVRLTEVTRTDHGIDHPVTFPEGAYLKAVFARVEPLAREHGREHGREHDRAHGSTSRHRN